MDRNAVRIVIAEDESIIRLDLKETLEEEGYVVVADTGRGDRAVELVRLPFRHSGRVSPPHYAMRRLQRTHR